MKINWKVRFRNRTWLVTFIAAVVALAYQVLGTFGVIPMLNEQVVLGIIFAVVDLLVMLGVVIDPTTPNAEDSDRAMSYIEPGVIGGDEKNDK